ncbi:MAG: hypothetical protein F4Z50_16825 [Gemmatimonadetes bacterium]|nr:hypothetical protein [Gemmatimonadota bacterium]MYD12141.1 hypothetical protein [Gemmatimonadota bacterium]
MNPLPGGTLSAEYITRFWSPLAATWVMMAVEGPVLAATIARLPDAKINLAAHGVAFAIAILVEGPVIMLMTAATALVRDADSYRRLRLFAHGLNGLATLLLCVLLIPAVFDPLFLRVLALPHEVADIVYGSLWIYLPWAAAIGYRRFIHGVMIISGKTRQVAVGTVFRLAAMAGTAFALASFTELPGAWVAAAGLTVGVCIEAVAARLMATGAIRRTLATSTAESGTPPLTWSGMVSFYYPLALTSMVALATHPVLTFLVGRARAPLESLAVLPVIHSLSFLFRAIGLSYQEAAIALMGREFEQRRTVARYAVVLAIATSAGYALFAVTPLFDFWFGTVSALTPELQEYARIPTVLIIPLPALSVWLAYQSAIMVMRRRTKAITMATSLGVAGIVAIFAVLAWGLDWIGATAVFAAFMGGRFLSNLYLHWIESR